MVFQQIEEAGIGGEFDKQLREEGAVVFAGKGRRRGGGNFWRGLNWFEIT
jgi:hypothetical protein